METDINKKIESIPPYTEEESMEAMAKLANNPRARLISKYIFPKEHSDYLRNMLRDIHNVDEFQHVVMSKAVEWVLENTVDTFSFDGVENIRAVDGKFLAMSNHRDIVIDPALTQYMLLSSGLPLTEIAVGDNLISNKTVEYLLRCNRMITVIRGISAKELYLTSQALSRYIRETVISGNSSVWIAQRQGRTKNGLDTTEQGLLKMFDMSGTKSFSENFKELNIIPLSISYEFEPCDVRKAREILISRSRPYVKKRNEDMHSIIMGIKQKKGNVHLHVGKKLTDGEIEAASACTNRNDRYQLIRGIVDRRIVEGYKLWKTNYLCYDKVYGTDRYSAFYTTEDVSAFEAYMEHRLDKVEKSLDRNELRAIFLDIYANPVVSKEKLERGEL